jgi:hypothetical protein
LKAEEMDKPIPSFEEQQELILPSSQLKEQYLEEKQYIHF